MTYEKEIEYLKELRLYLYRNGARAMRTYLTQRIKKAQSLIPKPYDYAGTAMQRRSFEDDLEFRRS